ncbi:MAG: IS630 transposase-related protein, partial [Eikenella corrodens]|uniref:IS630 transposase-related protein n=1 Tax=Eikenella corrodens TaxID=539 RepID=UPI00360723D1
MAYSADLRNKALNYYEQCKNISQTAATFNLSRNTLYLWIRLKKQTATGTLTGKVGILADSVTNKT